MEVSQASNQIIADLLAARTGQQLTESRRWRVGSALAGVFRVYGISNVDQLVCMLAQPDSPDQERKLSDQVVEALLNNETYFFRDKPTFDQLPDCILPELARRRQSTRRLSIWCAGCSTGQEAYSLAMAFADHADRWRDWSIDILGTDVSQGAIASAQSGLYSQFEVQRGLGVAQMLNHFEESRQGWQIRDATRSFVRFRKHNVLNDPPTRQAFDLILCRNVLLYFAQANRQRAFARLREALADDGFLMLGAGETVVGQTHDFAPSDGWASVYHPAVASFETKIAAAMR